MDTVIADASDIGAVANNIGDVTTVAGINSEVDTVAGISAKVTTVADNITDVQNADTNAANASASASQAANSASAAGASATTASTKATEASNSATAASNSATTATTKATEAAGSATTATTKATEASTSATNAATSATTATTKASEAASSATSASGSATTATTKASEADASATSAASSATDSSNAASTWTNYYSTYLGAADAPPTADVQGNALQTGAFYYDTGAGSNTVGLYVYNGSSWVYSTNYNNVTAPYSLAQDLATNSYDISFGDNDKAKFGASDDLQIYHDGSHSYIDEVGTGSLYIRANDFRLSNADGSQNHIIANNNGEVSLRYSGSPKLTTTSTGIDVTGTIKADNDLILGGADGTNAASIIGFAPYNWGGSSDDLISSIEMSPVVGTQDDGVIELKTANNINTGGTLKTRLKVDNLGDISFYEDTGTTPKLFWDASAERLGIGTSSPAANLHVSSSGDTIARITSADGNGAFLDLGDASDPDGGRIVYDSGSNLALYTSSSERMRIDSSGNVGIGTTSPAEKLSIQDGDIIVQKDTKATFGFKGTSASTALAFRDRFAGVDRLTIDSSGNVGIGITNPSSYWAQADNLVVGGTGNDGITIKSATVGNGRIAFTDTASSTAGLNDGGLISYSHNDDALSFQTSGSERLRINSSGNVGIGTSSPDKLLDLESSINPTVRLSSSKNGSFTANEVMSSLEFHSADTSGVGAGVRSAIRSLATDTFGSRTELTFSVTGVSSDTEAMRIDSDGKVGIGTTSPATQLHVSGASPVLRLTDSDTGAHSQINASSSLGALQIQADALNAVAGSFIGFTVDGSEKARINESGNVGIGTSSPVSIGGHTGVLTLHGDNATAIVLKDNVSRKDIRLDDGNLSVRNSAGESHLMVTDGGNVGIGTASPDSKVTVDGNLSFPEMSFKASNQTSRKLTIGMTDSTDHYISAVGSETKLLFKTQDTERMRIDSSGHLLVGKTSNSINTVGGQLNADGLLVATRDGGNTAVFNRKTSDGDIVQFRKDNTTVGSIGVLGSRPFFASTNCGIRLGAADLLPATSSGVISDNVVSLGSSSGRWKDLYLSKRVYSGNPSNTAGNLFLHIDGNADGVSTGYKIRSGVGVSTGSYHIAFVNPNGVVGTIQTNGSATSYNTSSDERLKENIQDADDAGSKIDAIQVRQFDWIIDGTHESYGVIAQELQSVAPEAVSGNPESEEMMGVDYSKLVPTLIKEIQTLRNRVAQLENN